MICPVCDNFGTVHPDGRGGLWCSHPFCPFEQAGGGWVYPEYVPNRGSRQPVIVYGAFSKTMLGGLQMHGWTFEQNGAPPWQANELYEFITGTLNAISTLPEGGDDGR